MVVDDSAGLVLSNLDEPDPDLLAQGLLREAGQAGQLAGQVDGEPAPQFGGVGVEQDVPGVVVAVRAEWLAQSGIVRPVSTWAGDVAAVRAAALAGVAAGAAGQLTAARSVRVVWTGPKPGQSGW